MFEVHECKNELDKEVLFNLDNISLWKRDNKSHKVFKIYVKGKFQENEIDLIKNKLHGIQNVTLVFLSNSLTMLIYKKNDEPFRILKFSKGGNFEDTFIRCINELEGEISFNELPFEVQSKVLDSTVLYHGTKVTLRQIFMKDENSFADMELHPKLVSTILFNTEYFEIFETFDASLFNYITEGGVTDEASNQQITFDTFTTQMLQTKCTIINNLPHLELDLTIRQLFWKMKEKRNLVCPLVIKLYKHLDILRSTTLAHSTPQEIILKFIEDDWEKLVYEAAIFGKNLYLFFVGFDVLRGEDKYLAMILFQKLKNESSINFCVSVQDHQFIEFKENLQARVFKNVPLTKHQTDLLVRQLMAKSSGADVAIVKKLISSLEFNENICDANTIKILKRVFTTHPPLFEKEPKDYYSILSNLIKELEDDVITEKNPIVDHAEIRKYSKILAAVYLFPREMIEHLPRYHQLMAYILPNGNKIVSTKSLYELQSYGYISIHPCESDPISFDNDWIAQQLASEFIIDMINPSFGYKVEKLHPLLEYVAANQDRFKILQNSLKSYVQQHTNNQTINDRTSQELVDLITNKL